MTKITIPNEIEYVITKLHEAGYQSYLVGGCLRDFLMGKMPKDYDVTTDAIPEEVRGVFAASDAKVIDTGLKHGTLTVIKNHMPVEVTTFRKESEYSDGRHPDHVSFSSDIIEDLARRDFTINAIAWNPLDENGSLVDPFGGIKDMEECIIRAVGNPDDRFSEDGLRIMRALRFASVLDFNIEENTARSVRESIHMLEKVSNERIQKELEGLLIGRGCERVLRDYSDVISHIIPEIKPMIGFDQMSPYHVYDVWEHTLKVVSNVPADPVLRLVALFHDMGKPSCFSQDVAGNGHFFGHPEKSAEMANSIMRRLKFDNKTREAVITLVLYHDLRPNATDKSVRKVLSYVGAELFDGWIAIRRGDNKGQAPWLAKELDEIAEVEAIGHRLIEEEGVLTIHSLNIGGKDLMELGVSEGPEIGKIMGILLQQVLNDDLPNEKELLLVKAKELI